MLHLYVFMALLSASVVIKLARPLAYPGPGGAPTRRRDRAIALCVIVLLPLIALMAYHVQGRPELPGSPIIGQAYRDSAERNVAQLAIRPMKRLLSANSEDLAALVEMGQINHRIGNYEDAIPYLRKAVTIAEREEDFRVRAIATLLGETLMLQAGGKVTEEAREVFEYILKLYDGSPLGRYYMGVYYAQQGDRARAIAQWRKLLAEGSPNLYWKDRVRKSLVALQEEMRLEAEKAQGE